MDCKKLHSDIERLKSLRDKMQDKVNIATETGRGKSELSGISRELTEAVDGILEKYLPDFAEKNSEICEWQLGELIDGFKTKRGQNVDILSISALSDGGALIGGWKGTLYYAAKGENNEFNLSPIDGLRDTDVITSISTLPDGSALIGGSDGVLYHAIKDEAGSFKLENTINFFKNKGVVRSISALPDGSALIGHHNAIYHVVKGEDGKFMVGEKVADYSKLPDASRIRIAAISNNGALVCYSNLINSNKKFSGIDYVEMNKDGSFDHVQHINNNNSLSFDNIITLSDSKALVSDDYGEIYSVVRDKSGNFTFEGSAGFGFAPDSHFFVNSVSALPDGSILSGGNQGHLYHIAKDANGKFKPVSEIDGFKKGDLYRDIKSISVLSDGSALIGGASGVLFHATKQPATMDSLKQNLDKIIDKNKTN